MIVSNCPRTTLKKTIHLFCSKKYCMRLVTTDNCKNGQKNTKRILKVLHMICICIVFRGSNTTV